MEQTPTFRCIKKYDKLNADKGHIIKMSQKSVDEIDKDKRFSRWRESFEVISLEEELSIIKK